MNVLLINLKPLAEGFRLLKIVVKSYFGQKVQPNFQTHIKNFDHYRILVEDFGLFY